MLVLTRTLGETIHIGTDVHIRLISIDGNQVRIGVEAPPHIAIDRGEIYQRKMDERTTAFAAVKSGKKTIPVVRKKSILARLYGREVR